MLSTEQYRPDQCTCNAMTECIACKQWNKQTQTRGSYKKNVELLTRAVTRGQQKILDTTLTSRQKNQKRYYIKQVQNRLNKLLEVE